MKKLKMKARAGVTLVELLVVMLIAVILAISLLPMFKEYICKAQYNAEAVPVIATLRTKISLYQYEHNNLPKNCGGDDNVSSWEFSSADKEKYIRAIYSITAGPTNAEKENEDDNTKLDLTGKTDADSETDHFGCVNVLDIDYQDLKGKKSRPIDYVYYNIPCDDKKDSAYIIGCFGSGHGGLAAGTGYAVCELNLVSIGKKYIGTFERYKAKADDDDDSSSTAQTNPNEYSYLYLQSGGDAKVSGTYVWCPEKIDSGALTPSTDTGFTDLPGVVVNMTKGGWKFVD